MHATQQNMKCRGCGKRFLKGAALLNHIEKNQCPVIHNQDLETQRAIVAISMEKISSMKSTTPTLSSFGDMGSSTGGSSVSGGVSVPASLIDITEDPEELSMNMPTLTRILSNSSSAVSTTTVRDQNYENGFPALETPQSGPEAYKGSSKDFDAIGNHSNPNGKGSSSGQETPAENKSWAKAMFPNAAPTPAPEGWEPASGSDSGFIKTVSASDLQYNHFRIMDFKSHSLDGLYHCPFPKCE